MKSTQRGIDCAVDLRAADSALRQVPACQRLTFLLAPRPIARPFTPDAAVVRTRVALLIVAAFFQLFDGLQVVATGALRGTGNTRTPMICHVVGYGLLGLPLDVFSAFTATAEPLDYGSGSASL
jgi:hypothetical protein